MCCESWRTSIACVSVAVGEKNVLGYVSKVEGASRYYFRYGKSIDCINGTGGGVCNVLVELGYEENHLGVLVWVGEGQGVL